MISYVKGALAEKSGDRIVVEAGPVGLGIYVPLSVLEVLPPLGEEVKIYTYLQVREDDLSLYGFLNRQDLDMFRRLIGVNGIGPKGALGILSALSPDDLRLAILTGDAKAISKEEMLASVADTEERTSVPLMQEAGREAATALVALGYSNLEASKAVKNVQITEDMDAEAVLRASLKYLAFL